MSSEIAIKVEALSKSYQIYEKPHDRLKQSIFTRLNRLFGRPHKEYFQEFSALKDVSFEVKRGETVGIIGRNGSGKSTLLQMICGTLNPTQGSIQVNGRVAALLELGAGFNAEFTGRENVFTNGALLGLSREEVEQKFDAILAFADIGMFIDQPVKTYSSGMFVRLAFAIAANLDPDVLIIDEALAVGDIAFQAKCMGRLKALTDQGTTILFVSHDLGSVRNLCQRTLWLKNGIPIKFGPSANVVDSYVRDMNIEINHSISAVSQIANIYHADSQESYLPFSEAHKIYGNGQATILDAVLINPQGEYIEIMELHEPFKIRLVVRANEDIGRPVIGYAFRDLKGNQVIGALTSNFPTLNVPSFSKGDVYCVEIQGVNKLTQGAYALVVAVENIVTQNLVHEYLEVVEGARIFRSTYGPDVSNIFPAFVWQDVDISFQKYLGG